MQLTVKSNDKPAIVDEYKNNDIHKDAKDRGTCLYIQHKNTVTF